MKFLNAFLALVCVAATAVAVWQWQAIQRLRAQQAETLTQLEATRAQEAATAATTGQKRETELRQLRADAQDAARLKAEIAQLRGAARDAQSAQTQANPARTANPSMRRAVTPAADAPPAAPVPAGTFTRDAWTFSGYATPESALVSAIWAMKEGNPKTYFESLTPDEQLRMTQVWADKTPEQIAAKHQGDVAKITDIRVVESHETAPDQLIMSVQIGGVDRVEKVSLKRIGDDWKFGGFIREPKQ
jgi:cytoskeletal protein RodZ